VGVEGKRVDRMRIRVRLRNSMNPLGIVAPVDTSTWEKPTAMID